MKAIGLPTAFPLTMLAASLAWTSFAAAQQPQLLMDTSEVRVIVRDTTGQPVRDARVVMHVMKRGTDQGDMEVRTNQEGQMEQDIIPVGNLVHLEILAPGFQAYRTDYQVNALVKNLVVQLKQQPIPQLAATDRLEEVAGNTEPAALPAAYKEPQWVAKNSQASTRQGSIKKMPAPKSAKKPFTRLSD